MERPHISRETTPQSLGFGAPDPQLCNFPSTRYQGSKRKILPWLWEHLSPLDFKSALDVFGGTGSVSYLLKRMGKQVTYNDYLRFNYQIGLALIENDKIIVSPAEIVSTLSPRRPPRERFVKNIFNDVYFTTRENGWIDNVVAGIESLPASSAKHRHKRALLYYALFQSCLIKRPFNLFHRRNLYLRLANVDRQFGNKYSWEKSLTERFRSFCAEANRLVFKGKFPCRATQQNASALTDTNYDLVYLDPPYLTRNGNNETSDYRRCYHFLEGLCSYKEWAELIDYNSPNLRFKDLNDNDWTDCKKQRQALAGLFETFRRSIIVMSYKKFGSPSIETLTRMLKQQNKRVRTYSRHYKYALNHQNGTAALNREVLLIAE